MLTTSLLWWFSCFRFKYHFKLWLHLTPFKVASCPAGVTLLKPSNQSYPAVSASLLKVCFLPLFSAIWYARLHMSFIESPNPFYSIWRTCSVSKSSSSTVSTVFVLLGLRTDKKSHKCRISYSKVQCCLSWTCIMWSKLKKTFCGLRDGFRAARGGNFPFHLVSMLSGSVVTDDPAKKEIL